MKPPNPAKLIKPIISKIFMVVKNEESESPFERMILISSPVMPFFKSMDISISPSPSLSIPKVMALVSLVNPSQLFMK